VKRAIGGRPLSLFSNAGKRKRGRRILFINLIYFGKMQIGLQEEDRARSTGCQGPVVGEKKREKGKGEEPLSIPSKS